ncbi:MAG: hypothetical protein J2P28_12990 [Actinobacteria bacterium]|nr:hypothetical protein [Actinomycetota bacterium]MBO0836404.1 hypothetical protein [Actinomycetota bacterium]
MLAELARQRTAEMLESAQTYRRTSGPRQRQESLRVRTGWTLVDLGLRLAARPGLALADQPRPAGS